MIYDTRYALFVGHLIPHLIYDKTEKKLLSNLLLSLERHTNIELIQASCVMKTLSDSRNQRRRFVTYILLSCIRKHGAELERVKFAVYEMLQLNFRARRHCHTAHYLLNTMDRNDEIQLYQLIILLFKYISDNFTKAGIYMYQILLQK